MSSNVVCLFVFFFCPPLPPPRTSRIAGYSRHRAFVYHACSRTSCGVTLTSRRLTVSRGGRGKNKYRLILFRETLSLSLVPGLCPSLCPAYVPQTRVIEPTVGSVESFIARDGISSSFFPPESQGRLRRRRKTTLTECDNRRWHSPPRRPGITRGEGGLSLIYQCPESGLLRAS